MEAGKTKKITDPMDVWQAYWQASAEALVFEARIQNSATKGDMEKTAARCRCSVSVIERALALDPLEVDIFEARERRKALTKQLVQHYLAVPMHLSIEKGRQTGEDFGEYMGPAMQAMRSMIPRWQLGRAPFANYINPRIKWAFHDYITEGRWNQSVELTDEYAQQEERASESGVEEQLWSKVNALPMAECDIVTRVYRLNQSPEEVAAELRRAGMKGVTKRWIEQEAARAVASLKSFFVAKGEG